jgi:hypothetical protein
VCPSTNGVLHLPFAFGLFLPIEQIEGTGTNGELAALWIEKHAVSNLCQHGCRQ